jgi:hypothetical protein
MVPSHRRRRGRRRGCETDRVDAETAVGNTHEWFEHNSGWAAPDADTLAEWVAAGVCRCPDECLVDPDGWCEHGLASWALVLAAQEREDGTRYIRRQRDRRDVGER